MKSVGIRWKYQIRDVLLTALHLLLISNIFVYQILRKLLIKCTSCKKEGIPYNKYIFHSESCIMSQKDETTNELSKTLKELKQSLRNLETKLNLTNSPSNSPNIDCIQEKLSRRN